MPSRRSSIAAARPEGPPPTSTGPSSLAIAPLQQALDLGSAEEPLATSHQCPGAAAQAVRVRGRNRPGQGCVDLAACNPLAEAHDPPVVGVGGDAIPLLVGARPELADVGHPEVGWLR